MSAGVLSKAGCWGAVGHLQLDVDQGTGCIVMVMLPAAQATAV
jgi:hypothetical protein